MKRKIKKLILGCFSAKIRRKTKLSKLQSDELAQTLFRALYAMNGWRIWYNRMPLRVVYAMDWKNFSLTEEKLLKLIGKPKYRTQYRQPIGMWYTIDSEESWQDAPRVENSDRVTYYASGREPFLAIANSLSPARKVVLAPYFTCATVFQPFLENGWEIVYYKVTKELKIDTQDVQALFDAHRPSMAVFMEYGGTDLTEEELETIGRLKRAGCVTVVDRSQNLYSKRRDPEVDFYCGSLRKWYCIPDGGYLERNGELPLPPVPEAGTYNDVYAAACAAMMFVNGLAQRTKIAQYMELSFFFRKLSTSYVCCQPVRERNMWEYSKAVYLREQARDEIYQQRRMENFRYVSQRIQSLTVVRLVCPEPTSAPFYVHVYTQDRQALSRYLRSKGISTWTYWSKPDIFGTLDAQTEYIFAHIVSLPCDQRYTLEDMEKLCDALEAYEKS